ncbi:BrnT family toxin [Castellaniella sp.]|uniref:BrnT family toxin n=1 Tax=Castellaniella sp. TaxID=1955812 RepID=UPI003C767A7C
MRKHATGQRFTHRRQADTFRALSLIIFVATFMIIIFDPVKDIGNRRKHGVSLTAVHDFEWDEALSTRDTRQDYGEDRMIAIGYIGLRLHVVVYVDRQDVRRIISLRKANAREVSRYAET